MPLIQTLPAPKPRHNLLNAGNAGKEKVIFTGTHPFFKNTTPDGKEQLQKAWRKMERKRVRVWAKENIQGKVFNSSKGEIHVNGVGIKEIINQPHTAYWEKNQLLFHIQEVIKRVEFIKSVPFNPDKKGAGIFGRILYFKIKLQKKENYLVIKKETNDAGGKMTLYSITEVIKMRL